MTPRLTPDHVHLWLADLADPAAASRAPATRDPAALEPLLSATEKRRAARFHHPSDRHRYILRHGLLRILLARYLERDAAGIEIATAAAGKPALAPGAVGAAARVGASAPWLRFSLSSSQDLCLFAFAHSRDVGVDVQAIDSGFAVEPMLDRLLTANEAAWWRTVPVAERTAAFHRLWVRKEACVKCTGEGATVDLTRVETGLGQASPGLTPVAGPARPIATDLEAPHGYAAALAVQGAAPQIIYSRL